MINNEWTVNLKSFEIENLDLYMKKYQMNCKLEKFWNVLYVINLTAALSMNCKLEKFWNRGMSPAISIKPLWTVNLKSFEILFVNKLSFYFL